MPVATRVQLAETRPHTKAPLQSNSSHDHGNSGGGEGVDLASTVAVDGSTSASGLSAGAAVGRSLGTAAARAASVTTVTASGLRARAAVDTRGARGAYEGGGLRRRGVVAAVHGGGAVAVAALLGGGGGSIGAGLGVLRGLGRSLGSLGGGRGGLVALAVEVKGRLAVSAHQAEAGAGTGILESVPPDVGLAEHGASDLLVVVLGVVGAGNGLVLSRANDGPASLGDPDGLASTGTLNLLESGVVQSLAVLNAVGLLVLEVGVGVHAEPVEGLDQGVGGVVDVGSPGVDVTNGGLLEAGSLDGLADLVDVLDEGLGAGTGETVAVLAANDGVTVQILGTDRDTGDEAVKLTTVLVGSLLERSKLVVEGFLASRAPDTEEEAGLGGNTSGNGRDGVVGGARLDHGVETGTVEGAVGAGEALGSLELGLEVGLLHVIGSVVEALEAGSGGADGSSHGEEARRSRHFDEFVGELIRLVSNESDMRRRRRLSWLGCKSESWFFSGELVCKHEKERNKRLEIKEKRSSYYR